MRIAEPGGGAAGRPARAASWMLLALVATSLLSCTPLSTHRGGWEDGSAAPGACGPIDAASGADAPCALRAHERYCVEPAASGTVPTNCRAGIDLHFVEFDDQGWAFDGGSQMRRTIAALEEAVRAATLPGDPGLAIVLYVHGWRHDARNADPHVTAFRNLLVAIQEGAVERRRLAAVSGARNAADEQPRRLVGVYVGWRGAVVDPSLGGLERLLGPLTFWDRKSTVSRVAQGQVGELIARIDAMSDAANRASGRQGPEGRTTTESPERRRAVRTLHLGHSLGGHILFTGLSGTVLRDVVAYQQMAGSPVASLVKRSRSEIDRQGDLIVLVNPAIEGSRFEPLLRAARSTPDAWTTYVPPLIVSITSESDVATGTFFEIGRGLSTLLEGYSGDASGAELQRRANIGAVGHVESLVTHRLYEAAQPPDCSDWSESPTRRRVLLESRHHRCTFAGWKRSPMTRRTFCGGMNLDPRTDNWPVPHPIWNVRASPGVIGDHGDVMNPRLIAFVRQLYLDSGDPVPDDAADRSCGATGR